MMLEQARALQWLITTLKAASGVTSAATAGVYRTLAPAGTSSGATYCIVQKQTPTGLDLTAGGGRRVMNRSLWVVKMVGPASNYSALVSGADAIDTAINLQSGTTSDGRVLACVRANDLEYDELVDGVLVSHLGGQYTIWAQSLS